MTNKYISCFLLFASASASLWPATSAAPAAAQFVTTDTTTQGNWQGVYGGDGWNIAGNSISYPSYALVSRQGAEEYTWTASTSDPRALQLPGSATGRVASGWLFIAGLSLDVNLTDGNSHQVALYCLDWNGHGRAEQIDILDADSGAVLDSRSVSSFAQTPQYLVWNLQGHVTIQATLTAGPNGAVSALFFGGAPTWPVGISMAPASLSLTGGQLAQFDATVTGGNTAVTWSLSPTMGTLANGAYQAPAIIMSQQTVTVTATSVADATQIASATVTLIPIAVTVSPGSVSVGAGGSAAQLGVVDKVHFTGAIDNAAVAAYYNAAALFVLPSVSRAEAFGIVQIEAMAAGLPVINTSLDTGVPLVSVHGETGLTVPPADPGALASAINQLLDDPILRQKFGLAGARRVRHNFSLDKMLQSTLDVYRDVAAKR